ncbi:MAG: transcriptional repressor [Rhodothermia bacterium]|nr:transcriptional repressor [Rhodothermia bacterium]
MTLPENPPQNPQEARMVNIREHFRAFLKERNQRQTPERFAILEEIYKLNDHFDADELYVHLKGRGVNISRATVYNTLELLVASNLVVKHQFGQNQAKYEGAYRYRQHDHLICLDCNHVLEYCDPRIQAIQEMVAQILNFEITHHALHMYGHCKRENCEFRSRKGLVSN